LNREDRIRQLREVETIFPSKMDEIRVMQLRLGKKFTRWGIDLSQIASSIPEPTTAGAPRTYTGSAPCW
jgi:hypothetical protein